jgi:Hydrophobic surface binding protein A
MQLKNFVVFGLLGGAYAQSAIAAGFANIAKALDTLDAAVLALSASANVAAAATDLTAKSSAVGKALADATAQINSAKELSIVEAANVLTPAKALQTQTKKTIDDLIAKKDVIAKAGQTATVKQQLQAQQSGAKTLSDAVVSKMPSATKSIAQNQADAISKEIARGLAAYS